MHKPSYFSKLKDKWAVSSNRALGLVTFFFFYGATNAAIKFTGRNLSSFETPPGPAVGLICAGFVVAATALIKLRPRK